MLIGLETVAWHLPSAVFGYLDFRRAQRDWQSSCKEAAAYFHIEEKTLRILAKEHPEVAVFMNRRYIILREEMRERRMPPSDSIDIACNSSSLHR